MHIWCFKILPPFMPAFISTENVIKFNFQICPIHYSQSQSSCLKTFSLISTYSNGLACTIADVFGISSKWLNYLMPCNLNMTHLKPWHHKIFFQICFAFLNLTIVRPACRVRTLEETSKSQQWLCISEEQNRLQLFASHPCDKLNSLGTGVWNIHLNSQKEPWVL